MLLNRDQVFRLVFVDPEAEGHHVALHARAILREAVRRGWHCLWLTSPHALAHPAAQRLLAEFGNSITVEAFPFPAFGAITPKRGSGTRYEFHHYYALRRSLQAVTQKYKVDVVYLAWMDYCIRLIGILGLPVRGLNYVGLHMHVSLHENHSTGSRIQGFNQAMIRRAYLRPHLRSVGVILEQFYDFAQSSRLPGREKITYIPDLAFLKTGKSRRESRQLIGAEDDDFIILAYGALTERKGIQELLNGCQQLAAGRRYLILLAGRQAPMVSAQIAQQQATLSQRAIRLIEWNRFLDDESEALAFAASDLVWMGYCGFTGSSGVLLQAATAGLPILACREGTIGWTTRRYELGLTVEPTDTASVASAISQLAENSTLRSRYGERGLQMAKGHTAEQFGSRICDLLQRSAQSQF